MSYNVQCVRVEYYTSIIIATLALSVCYGGLKTSQLLYTIMNIAYAYTRYLLEYCTVPPGSAL